MRRSAFLAFDEFVPDITGTYYTTQELNTRLGHTDQMAVHAIVDNVGGGATGVTISLEHSGDGRLWVVKNATLANGAFGTSGVAGADAGTSPTLAFVRLGVKLTGTTGTGHVRVHVTQRDQG